MTSSRRPPWLAAAAMAALALLPSLAQATTCAPITHLLFFACREGRCVPLFRVTQLATFYCARRHEVDSVPPAVAEALQPALHAFAGGARIDVAVRLIRERAPAGTLPYSATGLARPDISVLPDSGIGAAAAERVRYAELAAGELRGWQRRRALEYVLVPLVSGLLIWSCLVLDGRVARRLKRWRFALAGAIQVGLAAYGAGAVNAVNQPLSARIAAMALLIMIFELAIAGWRGVSRRAARP